VLDDAPCNKILDCGRQVDVNSEREAYLHLPLCMHVGRVAGPLDQQGVHNFCAALYVG
jgi:hypothetical protein